MKFTPEKLYVGQQWSWNVNYESAKYSDGWLLQIILSKLGAEPYIFNSTEGPIAGNHYFSSEGWDRSEFPTGTFIVTVFAQNLFTGECNICLSNSEEIKILADPTQSTSDNRSYAKRCLDAIEEVLFNNASKEILEYTFKDSTFKYKSSYELLNMRKYFLDEVRRENGLLNGISIYKGTI